MDKRKLTYDKLLQRVDELEEKLKVRIDACLEQNLLNTIQSFVYLTDKEGRVVYLNSFAAELMKSSPEKLIGRNCYDYMPLEIAEVRRAQNIKVFETGEPLVYRYKFRDRDLFTRVFRISDSINNDYYLSIITTDITEVCSIDDALRESEQKFRSIFNNIIDGIILVNETGTITEWNRCAALNTGVRSEEAIGNKIWDIQYKIITKDLQKIYPLERLRSIWENLLVSIKDSETFVREGKYNGLKGSEVLTEDLMSPMYIGDHKYLCVIQRDLTERRKAEQALKENEEQLKLLNKTQNKLFSIIAHDLKSPLSTVHGYLQLLRDSISENDLVTSEKYLDIIISSSKNNLSLLSNMLTWARSHTGQIEFNPVQCNLDGVVTEIKEILESSASLKNITIDTKIPSDTLVYADGNMMKTILQNLISNAIKFTPRGGSVLIRSEHEDGNSRIYISDNGVGINSSDMDKLFDISNIKISRGTDGEGGTGLGLFICREFVEKHGGKISAESKLGTGSTFLITLPDVKNIEILR
jgi:PAS domain S-box-containing protein